MTLRELFTLYLKARILSWFVGEQSVYFSSMTPVGRVVVTIASFQNGKMFQLTEPAVTIPDHVPDEWFIPKPPESPEPGSAPE
jgi:hypothetical protein